MSSKELEIYIEELKKSIELPKQVRGKLVLNKTGDRIYIYFEDIFGLDDEQVFTKDKRLITSVYVDNVSHDQFEKVYQKFMNLNIHADLIFNNNKIQHQLAIRTKEHNRLLKIDRNSIQKNVRLKECYVKTDDEGHIILESVRDAIFKELKDEYEIPDYIKERKELDAELEFHRQQIEAQAVEKSLILEKFKNKIELEKEISKRLAKENEKSEQLLEDSDSKLKIKYKELEELEELTEDHTNKINQLKKYKLIKEGALNTKKSVIEESSLLNSTDFDSYSKLIDYIHGYILNKGIYYERETILDFFALVRTHDFIILAGQSGVGKTTIIKEFARAVNAKVYIIPVKPNWMSKEDLLGYYNPIQKQYISTEFLDSLLEAQNNPDKPYFICLDEMNLARVEYYFADFLSKLEDRGQEIKIQLYSNNLYPDLNQLADILKDVSAESITPKNITDFKDLITYIDHEYGLNNATPEEYCRTFRQLIPSIPPSITIGDNVHFFGTANIDETTHYFSEKVLDRMQVLKFSNPLKIDNNKLEKTLKNYAKRKAPFTNTMEKSVIVPVCILGKRNPYPNIIDEEVLKEEIVKLYQDYLEKINISIGWRIIRQSANYLQQIRKLNSSNEDNYKIAFNSFMRHKILPRISIHTESELESVEHLGKYLKQNYEEYEVTKELQDIINRAKNNNFIFNYWSR